MPAIGYVRAWAYTSRARMPLKDVAVSVTEPGGRLIALRLTDESGLTEPIQVTVPDLADSQQPETGARPFTQVNLNARLSDFERIEIKDLQVFAETVTLQELAMIPLSELPGRFDKEEVFDTPAQNL